MQKIQCPCCLAEVGRKSVYRRDFSPAMNNVTYKTAQEAAGAPIGKLDLILCSACGVVFNAAFDESILNYNANYDNSRNKSGSYCRYLDELCDQVAGHIQPGAKICEVGCGKGDFLVKLCEKTGAEGYGYDTTYTGEHRQGTARFYKEYFNPMNSPAQFNVLVFRHVLEHISQPYDLLKRICRPEILALEARLFIETPDIEWIVKQKAFYDVTFEHCNYFSKRSLGSLVSAVGFHSIESRNVFGGQYIFGEAVWRSGPVASDAGKKDLPVHCDLDQIFGSFQKKTMQFLQSAENVCVWGASGKGVIFLSSLDKASLAKVKYVVDINSNKQGRYLPFSAKRVESPDILKQVKGAIDVLVMNELYQDEIKVLLRDMGVKARVHTI